VNVRDERSIGEQVKSGLRLAGWVLLTLALIYALLICTGFLLGKDDYNQPIFRVVGAFGVGVISTVMFVTTRRWVGWFIGVLGYFALKTVLALLLGSSLVRSRLWFTEFALLVGLGVLLCARYVGRKPQRIEAAGLVGLVLALSFTLVCDSNTPILVAVCVLTVIQFAQARKQRTPKLNRG
jgi:hypothetical protein